MLFLCAKFSCSWIVSGMFYNLRFLTLCVSIYEYTHLEPCQFKSALFSIMSERRHLGRNALTVPHQVRILYRHWSVFFLLQPPGTSTVVMTTPDQEKYKCFIPPEVNDSDKVRLMCVVCS